MSLPKTTPRSMPARRVPMAVRVSHLCNQLAPSDEEKQARLPALPLFDVALRGRLVLRLPKGR